VAQFRSVGASAHVAAMSLVIKDVPHFTTVMGNPATAIGLNVEGLKRRGLSGTVIRHLRDAYKVVYRDGLTVEEACAKLAGRAAEVPEVAQFVDSVRSSRWGITRPRGRAGDGEGD
jgi:UDP-N-acetylglucosamine acyltransferase